MERQRPAPLSCPRNGRCLSLVFAAALLGCATAEPAVLPPPPPEPPELDPSALCLAAAEIEDARGRGDVAAARARWEERAEADPGDRVAAFAARYAVADDQERWRGFREDAEQHPESAVGPLGECFTYADWKMADKAQVPCERAAARSEGLVLVDVARADLAKNQGEPDKARGHLEAALAAVPTCVPALVRLAALARAAKDAQGAVAAFDHALEAWPGCFSCAAAKAELVEEEQGAEAALPRWEEALAIAPDHAPTVKRFAASAAGRDPGKALLAYEKAIELGVNDAATLLAAARLAEQGGEVARALGHARAATAAQPDDLIAWRRVAALAEKQGGDEAIAEATREVLRLAPDDAAAHLRLARMERAAERWVEALTHLELAVASDGDGDGDGEGAEDEDARAAAAAELDEVLATLMVAKAGPTGPVNRVVGIVQRDVRKLFEARLKENKGMSGTVEVTVVTGAEGEVEEVTIASDTLKDPQVAAALVGSLRRATIRGGAKRYSFELEFK